MRSGVRVGVMRGLVRGGVHSFGEVGERGGEANGPPHDVLE